MWQRQKKAQKKRQRKRRRRLKRPNILIAGLGNPGKEYEKTRHNAGFLLCEYLREDLSFPPFLEERRFKGEATSANVQGIALTLFKPLTFMNRSGEALRCLFDFFKLDPTHLLVCHDDLDLPLGRIRFQRGGGSGGHRGIESVISHLGTKDFPRLRLGIGRPPLGKDVKEYVLEPFTQAEYRHFCNVLHVAKDGVMCFVEKGIDHAMNSFNGRIVEP